MYRSENVNRGSFLGNKALLALMATIVLLLGAPKMLSGQSTGAIFTTTGYVTSVNSVPGIYNPLGNPDYQGSAGHLAGNSRGDFFFVDAPYSYPNTAYLVQIPANGGAQVTLLSGLGYGSDAVFVDSGNNLWVGDESANIIYVPFENGTYSPAGKVSPLLTCTMPILTNTTACKFYWNLPPSVGYYVQPSDVALDGAGNVYVVDKYDGSTKGSLNRILEFSGANGDMTLLVDNLPSVGGAQLAVDSAGDVYYADGNGVYLFAASSFPTTTGVKAATKIGTGLNEPTGVSLDTGGNLYISDQGNDRILEIPNENGALSTANQFVLTGTPNISSVHAQDGVGIDGYGNIYYVGNSGNSINYLKVGNFSLGATGIGSATSATTLDLYFIDASTFGSFTLSGPTGVFALGTNGCITGKAYAAGVSCTVNVTYAATAAGVQTGSITALDNSGNLLGEAVIFGTGTTAVLNVDPSTVAAIGATWKAPGAIAVDESGNTYVADGGKIYETAPGGTPAVVASGFSDPTAVVVDGAGSLYVGDSGNNQVVEVPYFNSAYGTPIVLATGLSGATGLALDGSGDLYIADSGNSRVLLISRSGDQQAQSLQSTVGSGFMTPVAVAVDGARNLYVSDSGLNQVVQVAIPTSVKTPILSDLKNAAGVAVDAGGSLYAADAGSGKIYRVPSIGGELNKNFQSTLANDAAAPNAIAVDSYGNVFVADAVDASVSELNRSAGALNFGNVNVLESSTAVAASLSDGGTTALTLNSPFYTISGSGTASFAVQDSSTCAAGSVNPGVSCTVAGIFTPQSTGLLSETLNFSSTASNSSALTLTGTGTNLVESTLTIAVTSPTGTPAYGQAVTVSATLTPNTGGIGTPTGTVTFYVDTVPQPPVPLANNAASITLAGLLGGQHVISASYSGDNSYASAASTNLSLTVNTAATSISSVTLTASPIWTNPTSIATDESLTLSAVVSNTVNGTPTGTVTFVNGITVLGSGPISATGQATTTITSLKAGNYSITAIYTGDPNFSGSTSASAVALLVSAPTITMAANSSSVSANGSPVTLTFNSIAGFGQASNSPNTISLACSGLPKYAVCSFTPAYAAFVGGATQASVTFTVLVNQPPPIPPTPAGLAWFPRLPGHPGLGAFLGLCLLLPGMILGFTLRRARRGNNAVWRAAAMLLLMLSGCLIGLSGCNSSNVTFTTPAGQSNFTVTASITPATPVPNPPPAQTLQFNLTVN